ncbi:MAG: cytochrome c-type biogenesis protein CcmH [Actinomycetota bacterium]|nr:cytochrome c-type biogenesis protein CcmH [Actinomycetota bacterium]
MRRTLAAVVGALALALPAAGLAASCPKTTLGDIEDEVMCPVCGTSLALATEAPQAQRQRQLIRRLVDGCRSKDEVKAVLAAEFGDEVLAMPGGDGFDLAAYVVPGLALLLGGAALGAAALGWRKSGVRERANAEERRSSRGAAATERLESDLERYEL